MRSARFDAETVEAIYNNPSSIEFPAIPEGTKNDLATAEIQLKNIEATIEQDEFEIENLEDQIISTEDVDNNLTDVETEINELEEEIKELEEEKKKKGYVKCEYTKYYVYDRSAKNGRNFEARVTLTIPGDVDPASNAAMTVAENLMDDAMRKLRINADPSDGWNNRIDNPDKCGGETVSRTNVFQSSVNVTVTDKTSSLWRKSMKKFSNREQKSWTASETLDEDDFYR
jgi:hypothetical protein